MISMVRALVICGELGSQSVKEYFSLFLSVSRHQIVNFQKVIKDWVILQVRCNFKKLRQVHEEVQDGKKCHKINLASL